MSRRTRIRIYHDPYGFYQALDNVLSSLDKAPNTRFYRFCKECDRCKFSANHPSGSKWTLTYEPAYSAEWSRPRHIVRLYCCLEETSLSESWFWAERMSGQWGWAPHLGEIAARLTPICGAPNVAQLSSAGKELVREY